MKLDGDIESPPKSDLGEDDTSFRKPRRHLRYRAAGEYVASYSDLLLAVYDDAFDLKSDLSDVFNSGAATIVATKQQGLTWGLLGVSNSFSWADNGPVLRIPIDRKKNPMAEDEGAKNRKLIFLHPLDCRPDECEDDCPADHPKWQRNGDKIFRSVIGLRDEFNDPKLIVSDEEKKELFSLMLGAEEVRDVALEDLKKKALEESVLENEVLEHAKGLGDISRVRRRAALLSRKMEGKCSRLLLGLILLIGVATICLGAFDHWSPQSGCDWPPVVEGVDELSKLIKVVLLTVTLLCLAISAIFYYRHLKGRNETRQHDARALAEALRVQFYWSLAGLARSVPANYMQRQRNELNWIRYAASGLGFPYNRWRESFCALSQGSRLNLLELVQKQWLGEQKKYFGNNITKLSRKLHFWHTFAWSCAVAGLIQVIWTFVAEISQASADFADRWALSIALIFVALSLKKVISFIKFAWDPKIQGPHHNEEYAALPGFFTWIFKRPEVWSGALFISAFVFYLPYHLALVSQAFPSKDKWWIILTGVSLLIGALSLAWSERNFHSELYRQYQSMYDLYGCANRRMEKLLKKLEKEGDWESPESTRTLDEINDLLYNLGCEALDENAEWLILHRARPLEPFMTG